MTRASRHQPGDKEERLRLIEGFSITGLVFLFFVGGAEATLHHIHRLQPVPQTYVGEFPNGHHSRLVADQLLGWRLPASSAFGARVRYRSNSSGFRSNREFHLASPGEHLLALVGDSFAFGVGVQYEQTFGSLIEKDLHMTLVYNFGVPGFGMDQMWQTLRTQSLPLKPDLAIVAFISPDFSRTPEAYRPTEGFNKPTYKLDRGKLVLRTIQDRPNFLVRAVDAHSSLWRVGKLASRMVSHYVPLGEWWFLNQRVLDEMRADCASHGVRVLFVYIPTADWRGFPTLRAYMRRTQADFIDMAEDNRMPMVGTTLPDGHLNDLGHRYVAEAVSRWIRENRPAL